MSLFLSVNKYHAFTLTELLVGMIVSGIVISCIWTAFRVVSQLAQASLTSEVQVEQVSFFKRSCSIEFQNADSVAATTNGFALFFKDSTENMSYVFSSEYVLRKSEERTDTFHVQTSDLRFNGIGVPDNVDSVKTSAVKFTILTNGVKQDLVLSRTLSSLDLMESND